MSKKEKAKLVETAKKYSPEEAIKLVKQTSWAKFKESVDMAIKLDVDVKKGGFSIRGFVPLPHGSGKKVKVAVIAKADKLEEAKAAGADVMGAEDLIEKISKGFFGFDVVLATPDMMSQVGKLGKILGTKGLMPNPKSGTVTMDIKKVVTEFKSGKMEFRMDKGGVVHLLLGKVDFPEEHLVDNLKTAVTSVYKTKPSGTKGNYIKSITISSTMGPAIKIDQKELIEQDE
ncbi:MAG: large subunit ribosomal protein L1 [Candidatus Saganbacteria bacterium]|uniref:Large ribosomal subunit protein uL1 n=1 Tax=Candidatus Saganbacteria bacterium TaxID=2575572 RepID=A0A833NX35_UNCSA|nr:MAG: large subunit ribosomal protein L1 [Candidatus Saganbacteria bacterium]